MNTGIVIPVVSSSMTVASGAYSQLDAQPVQLYRDPNNSDALLSEEQYLDHLQTELENEYHKERQQKWDLRFLEQANDVASWSKDPSTKCGAIIVRPNLSVCSVGFNGFPKQMPDESEYYENREEKYSRIVHCEMNALIHSYEDLTGYTLYTTGPCCDRCAVHLIQAGIDRFVAYIRPSMQARWGEAFKKTYRYYEECGVEHVEYDAPDLVLS